MMELRDTLAAQIAATLAHSTLSPPDIARRAYAVADAMLFERAEPCWLDPREEAPHEHIDERLAIEEEPDVEMEPSHDPRWEVSPRWSREDLAALEARRRGPGLAKRELADDEDEAQRTG